MVDPEALAENTLKELADSVHQNHVFLILFLSILHLET